MRPEWSKRTSAGETGLCATAGKSKWSYILQRIEKLQEYCEANAIPASFIHVDTLAQAKALPCVFNNWAVFYDGKFVTVNQLDGASIEKIVKK